MCLAVLRCMFLFVLAVGPTPGWAQARYQVTPVGTINSRAYDLNNLGQVVGLFDTGAGVNHAFLFDGSLRDLGTLGGANSAAFRINDAGQVVGTSDTAASSAGFLYSGGTLNAIPTTYFSSAIGINHAGVVVGMQLVQAADGELYRHAYRYADGSLTDLGTLPIGDNSEATAINNAGRIVGQAANVFDGAPNYPQTSFLYRDGHMADIGNFGGVWSSATSINELDQVVGYSGLADSTPFELYPTVAYLFADGVLRALGGLAPGYSSWAYDINNLGQVVGAGRTPAGDHAFLYEGGMLIDLNTLIDPATGWTVTEASGINDQRQIAATACRAGDCYAVRLDLVSAVPDVSPVAGWGAGMLLLGALAFVSRRHHS